MGMEASIGAGLYLEWLECPRKAWYSYRGIPRSHQESSSPAALGLAVRRLQREAITETAAAMIWSGEVLDLRGLDLGLRAEKTIEAREAGNIAVLAPAFTSGRLIGEPDVIVFGGDWKAGIVLTTSSSSLKERHLLELAWHASIIESLGIIPESARLARIDRDAEPDAGDTTSIARFLAVEDVTFRVLSLSKKAASAASGLAGALDEAEPPPRADDASCSVSCPFHLSCGKILPKHHVRSLHMGAGLAEKLMGKGISLITDIPEGTKLSRKQRIQVDAVRSNLAHVDTPGIQGFLSKLVFPLSFLDFETFNTALPLFPGLSPWENVPFQFSLHVLESWGLPPSRRDFLAGEDSDPRPAFLSALLEKLPPAGSVIVYNRRFEEGVLRSLAFRFPEFGETLETVIARLLDLLSPFSEFSYYHPEQLGRVSMKRVLPAMTGFVYDGLAVGNGADANLAFAGLVMLSRKGALDDRTRADARDALAGYCSLDSRGMALMLEELKRIAGGYDR